MAYLYIFGTVLFTVYGQLILKWRINDFGTMPEGVLEKLLFLFNLLLDPWIFSGFVSAFVASFFWMAAMTKFDVSHAYPIIVGGLAILTSVFAVIFLRESVSLLKIFGIIMIVSGVFLLSKGS